jgi:hypothetical protein
MTFTPSMPGGIMVTQFVASIAAARSARGNEQITFTPRQVGPCAFVPQSQNEATSGTEQITSLAELYLPSGTVVGPLDRFQVPGNLLYEVTGNQAVWKSPFTGIESPVRVHLTSITGAAAHAPSGNAGGSF